MNKEKIYLNLTNGLEILKNKNFQHLLSQISFIRIQSTACEQKRWNDILYQLSDDLLLHLAIGYKCIIIDASKKECGSRALYQGVEWIKYVLNRAWFKNNNISKVKEFDCSEYFNKQYENLTRPVRAKIKYYKKFLNTDNINIKSVSIFTNFDSDYDYFKDILLKYYNN